ncbi:Liprin-alpha-2 [Acromyrmex echinatior]|uniref:Liprin-alpha-2 n=1 Tax=Acromyrmex echinatior TaxID=103372 RepID=F4WBC5_ACREC|nr:Liprin-alpha-2 [Acromyrmex echinatior]
MSRWPLSGFFLLRTMIDLERHGMLHRSQNTAYTLRLQRRCSGGVGRAFDDGDVMAQDGRRYREWCIVDEAGRNSGELSRREDDSNISTTCKMWNMMCDVMPTIAEDSMSQRSSQFSGEDGNIEQLMVQMLDERDKMMESMREHQERLQEMEARLTEVEKERDALNRQLNANIPQACGSAHLVGPYDLHEYTPANRGRVRLHGSRHGNHVDFLRCNGKPRTPDGREYSAEAEKTPSRGIVEIRWFYGIGGQELSTSEIVRGEKAMINQPVAENARRSGELSDTENSRRYSRTGISWSYN